MHVGMYVCMYVCMYSIPNISLHIRIFCMSLHTCEMKHVRLLTSRDETSVTSLCVPYFPRGSDLMNIVCIFGEIQTYLSPQEGSDPIEPPLSEIRSYCAPRGIRSYYASLPPQEGSILIVTPPPEGSDPIAPLRGIRSYYASPPPKRDPFLLSPPP